MNLKIGIHPDRDGEESYSEKWTSSLIDLGHDVVQINLFSDRFLDQVEDLNALMWRWLHTPKQKQVALTNLRIAEEYLDLPVFPSQKISWHFDDKIAQYYLLSSVNAPQPGTYVFYDENEALEWASQTAFPKVFKLYFGAGSSNVRKISNHREAERSIRRIFHNGVFGNERAFSWKRRYSALRSSVKYVLNGTYPPLPQTFWMPQKDVVLFQDFVPDNAYDIRVTIIGERAFGFIRGNRPGDFRASGSGQLIYDYDRVDPRCIRIAFQVARRLELDCVAFDFLLRDGEPVIIELSYTFNDRAVFDCEGHWDESLNWHGGHMWPQEAQVEVFVKGIEAK